MSRTQALFGLVVGLLILVTVGILARTYLQQQSPLVVSVPDAERAIPDLATLVHASNLIVVGRVASNGTTLPPQTPGSSLPTTQFPFDIEQVVRGAVASGSSRITLLQPGGATQVPIFLPGGPTRSRVVQFEDDSLMSSGDRYVLFLQSATDGSYTVVGGAQGRLSIDDQNRVHPLHPGIPPTRDHDGQALNAFLADVAAIS